MLKISTGKTRETAEVLGVILIWKHVSRMLVASNLVEHIVHDVQVKPMT